MLWKLRVRALVVLLPTLAGCGVRPVTGGTKGVLRYDGKLLSDIQVTVYQVAGGHTEPIGFGVTVNDGSFQLVQTGAADHCDFRPDNIVAHSNRPARRRGLPHRTLTPKRRRWWSRGRPATRASISKLRYRRAPNAHPVER